MNDSARDCVNHSSIHLENRSSELKQFRTAVSLHSHTLCSRESLGFIYKFAKRMSLVRHVVNRGHAKYLQVHGAELNLRRGWWTPPVAPRDAWLLEKGQLENRLGKQALVSLTDHDTIEAPLSLRLLDECRGVPISVEWTVPYAETFFHLGVHNLPANAAQEWMARLNAFTNSPDPAGLPDILNDLHVIPDVLVVFNHPCWDERPIGRELHIKRSTEFARAFGFALHAFELNGLRGWPENRETVKMAKAFGKPLITGGDRHTLEPNTLLNLTNAATFSEFASEVRGGESQLLITNAYRECLGLRILRGIEETLQNHENHGRGWVQWTDRCFYICDDGVTRSLTELFKNRPPAAVRTFVRGVHIIRMGAMRNAFRFAFPKQVLALEPTHES